MSNLFITLRARQPTQNRDPQEDYVTDAFAWLLQQEPLLCTEYVRLLDPRLDRIDPSAVRWQTQCSLKTPAGAVVRPDLVCLIHGGPAIVCEHKVWSPLREDQLSDYRAAARVAWPTREVMTVLVTARARQHTQPATRRLTWADVHRLCKDHPDSGATGGLVRQFAGLLAHLGLGPPAPLAHDDLWAYYSQSRVDAALPAILCAVAEMTGPGGPPAIRERLRRLRGTAGADGDPTLHVRERKWGRAGVTFDGPWTPGFFFGLMMDTTDHAVDLHPAGSPAAGPAFVGILSFQPGHELAQGFLGSTAFDALRSRLRGGAGRWTFVDPHAEPGGGRNPWHRLFLAMPTAELLRGTTDHPEQVSRIVDAIGELTDLWLDGGELERWRASLPIR
jgi:hypothetical protein